MGPKKKVIHNLAQPITIDLSITEQGKCHKRDCALK